VTLPLFDPWLTGSVAADVWAVPHDTPAGLARRQSQRLHRLLEVAGRRSAWFRKVLAGRDPAATPLDALPVSHKAELMAHFADWVTDPALSLVALNEFTRQPQRIGEAFLGRYMVWESSGSSGEPGVFVQDRAAMAVYDALEACRRPGRTGGWPGWMDPWRLHERIAFVGATSGHFASIVSIERLRRLNPVLAGRTRSLSFLQPLERLAEQLEAARPTVLATYPSAAHVLAQEQVCGRLRLDLREVWTGGETLTPAMRRFIQQAWPCSVHDSYGASEFLAMASECRLGQLHLNADWFILEPVDERGRAVPAGTAGSTTLLTSLANHVQPLIRYDLGDRVVLAAEPCACGSCLPVVQVQGRRDDVLHVAGARRALVPLLPLAITTVLEDEAQLFDFQLRQLGPGELVLSTGRRGPDAGRQLRRGRDVLARFLAEQGAAAARIQCRTGQPGLPGRSGKLPRVVAAGPESCPGTGRRHPAKAGRERAG
jgi:phenylacetate-coenzyme A ligase PaaK-like adenylate-forming protein